MSLGVDTALDAFNAYLSQSLSPFLVPLHTSAPHTHSRQSNLKRHTTMGAGASIAAEELSKPLDASDVQTPRGESALAEVRRLRLLLAEAKEGGGESKEDAAAPAVHGGQYQQGSSAADIDAVEQMGAKAAGDGGALKWGRLECPDKAAEFDSYLLHDHLTMQFPMYVLPVKTLLTLEKMESYEVLKEKGLLVEFDPKANGSTFFLSHQWTAFNEPDHTGMQMAAAKTIFAKMADLTIKESFGEFNPGNVMPSTEWDAFSKTPQVQCVCVVRVCV